MRGGFIGLLPSLQFFAFIISLILLLGIIYLAIRSHFLIFQAEKWSDILNIKNLSRRRSLRGWRQILKRLHSSDQVQWKLAVMEADRILDEILKMAGYKGESMDERLEAMNEAQLSNLEQIKNAHRIRQQISQNPDFQITRDEARGIIKIYSQAFTELQLID